MVSTNGGEEPAWSPGGNELFFRNADSMMTVSIDTDGELTSGAPRSLFEWRFVPDDTNLYDVSPDGTRFVMIRHDREPLRELKVVLDWTEELQRP